MTDEEEQAWLDDGIGQPPSRGPAGSISKALIVIAVALVAAFVIAAVATQGLS